MSDALRIATDIVKKLTKEGYTAYFAGGWPRDFLMGHPSDDIDIATDAPPEKILDLFPRTILVGLSFGIIVVVSEGHQFEVATFRKDIDYKDGRKPTSIEKASAIEDAQRRDFTINGMFYDPIENKIYDHVGGQKDLKMGIIKAIGNPHERFFEDRLRMIRAVRFSGRFQFAIDPETEEAIKENAPTLFPSVAMERVWQEFNKMTLFPHFDRAILDMERLGLLEVIFPQLKGLHLHDLRKRIEPFDRFPPGTPTIAYLFELFPDASMEEWENICRNLKTSQKELKLVQFFLRSHHLWNGNPFMVTDPVGAVHFYAHPDSGLYLNIAKAKLPVLQRQQFLDFHEEQQKKYGQHIHRVKFKTPLVNAAILKAAGVPPGPNMGRLLSLAEQFTIVHDFNKPEQVIPMLRNSPEWPSNSVSEEE